MSILFNTYEDWVVNQNASFIKVSADDFIKELEKNTTKNIYLGNIEVVGDVNLGGLKFDDWFNCGSAKFEGAFSCDSARFEGRFFCDSAKFEDGFSCGSAKFEGWFSCNSAKFERQFFCGSAEFESRFFCDNAKFGGGITTNGATLNGKKINNIKVVSDCGYDKHTIGLFDLEGENYLRIECKFDTFDKMRQEVIDQYGVDNEYVKKIDSLRV